MSEKGISLHLHAESAEDVLKELVALIGDIKDIPGAATKLLDALREREKLCSTGVGDGVAFPHCRHALVGLVKTPVVVFGRHENGVAYGAVDSAPAKLFFLVVAPSVSIHLQILARLGRMSRDDRFRQSLLNAKSSQEVLDIIERAENA
ncbi:MAG TPA: PTS sugar transporter subunit IIA [Verrucomicrobiota bacterium]|jgi:mannitol/fructose-specific phosphotransferase system IIA component (Ntr-type)|nr:PTS sugar transporter subunit IIA [Verrucomicrobiota bacterium]